MNQLNKIGEIINNNKYIAIIGHDNLDGDAMGSILGLGFCLKKNGKIIDIYAPSKNAKYLEFIRDSKHIKTEFEYNNYDLIIFCDCGHHSMIKKFRDGNKDYFDNKNKIVLDHHVQIEYFGNYNFVDTNYSSCCEIILDLIETNWQKSIDSKISTFLLTGLITDTNNLINTNVNSNTFINYSKLLSYGAKREMIIEKLYLNSSYKGFKMIGELINRTQKSKNFIYTYFTKQELDKQGLSKDQASEIMEHIRRINEKKIYITFFIDDEIIKGSIRSRNHKSQKIASELFSGGGHTNAAGFKKPYNQDFMVVLNSMIKEIDLFIDNNKD